MFSHSLDNYGKIHNRITCKRNEIEKYAYSVKLYFTFFFFIQHRLKKAAIACSNPQKARRNKQSNIRTWQSLDVWLFEKVSTQIYWQQKISRIKYSVRCQCKLRTPSQFVLCIQSKSWTLSIAWVPNRRSQNLSREYVIDISITQSIFISNILTFTVNGNKELEAGKIYESQR